MTGGLSHGDPDVINVYSGKTLLASYDVKVSDNGLRSLVPTAVAPNNTVVDTSKELVTEGFHKYGVGWYGAGSIPIVKKLRAKNLYPQTGSKIIIDSTDLDHTLAVVPQPVQMSGPPIGE